MTQLGEEEEGGREVLRKVGRIYLDQQEQTEKT